MILLGLGSNLTTERHKTSSDILRESLKSLIKNNVHIESLSSWYRSAPVPASDQPWFVNAVASLRTDLPPRDLLAALHGVEAEFGRVRSVRNASRTLDLDLLAYGDAVIADPGGLVLPHPRLAQRAFVLLPLAEIAPAWRHPVSGMTAGEMLAELPPGQAVEKVGEAGSAAGSRS
jgi:2-amino-4-hydroxy-6-hydroxymethyldihydropteridine diphosphokinase